MAARLKLTLESSSASSATPAHHLKLTSEASPRRRNKEIAFVDKENHKEKEKEKKIIVVLGNDSNSNSENENWMLSLHYLHLHLLQSQSTSHEFRETLTLPFSLLNMYETCGVECRGFLLFDVMDGTIFLCNPLTGKLSFFPRFHRSPNQTIHDRTFTQFNHTALGYDRTHDDYKILRTYFFPYSKAGENHDFAELYSFKTNCWREIDCPQSHCTLYFQSSGYCHGSFYWATGDDSDPTMISFDFATETFSDTSPLPITDHRCFYHFVEFDDKLGVVTCEILYGKAATPPTRIEVWVLEEDGLSWTRLFHIALDNFVVEILALQHGLLFLEANKSRDQKMSQLLVWELATDKLEWLEIYDKPKRMKVFSYIDTHQLPDLPDTTPIPINAHFQLHYMTTKLRKKLAGGDFIDLDSWSP
ncbi:hypothetical protein OROMI_020059 [Orobanche minor]